MAEQPWDKWFWSDWESDEGLRASSLAARGLWMGYLGIMRKAMPRGHLLVNGRKPDARELARLIGASTTQVQRLTEELLRNGVPSQTDEGVLYNRRMVRDTHRKELNQDRQRRYEERQEQRQESVRNSVAERDSDDPPSPPPTPPSVSPRSQKQKPEADARARGRLVGHHGHAFCGERFCVPQSVHESQFRRLGPQSESFDLTKAYVRWDAALLASGEAVPAGFRWLEQRIDDEAGVLPLARVSQTPSVCKGRHKPSCPDDAICTKRQNAERRGEPWPPTPHA